MTTAIELRGVRKAFGPKVAVEHFDLSIERGTLTGFIGPNGAGKTTTIRIIMSILFADAGTVSVLGKASAIESKDRIGYLPEERGLYKKMKVGPFLTFMARLKGVPEHGLASKVRDWLARVGLADCERKKCEELSKGMQQKVQFISAVIHEPELVILDEPFSGLDPVNSRLLRTLIDEQRKRGTTIIFSTHQMAQAEALCDRVVMIHRGRKVLDDTPELIRSRFDPRALVLEPARGNVTLALQEIPEIAGTHADNGLIRVDLREGVDAVSMIPRVAAAAPCKRIEVLRPTLEDIFVQIVEGTDADADAATLRESLRAGVVSDSGGD
ncbi:MAG: ATP-binding cassette domain-containing protein [Planctomycetota bacterium]|nr:ATP-binding cassette domain-containing protein [Planctomycetota bacterium]